MVNSYAVDRLTANGWDITQFTILDAPLILDCVDEDDFRRLLPPASLIDPGVTWVDNYIANDKLDFTDTQVIILNPPLGVLIIPPIPLLPTSAITFSGPIQGAAPSGGMVVDDFNHLSIHEFYRETILDPDSQEGFFFSPVLGLNGGFFPDDDRLTPRFWNPPQPTPSTLELLPETILEVTGEGWRTIVGVAEETVAEVLGVITDAIRLLESSDSIITLNVSIPPESTSFAFDFVFANSGDGDWLTLSFNGNVLWSFLGESFVGTEFLEATVSTDELAGRSGVLSFTLHSTGAVNAEAILSNFRFLQTDRAVAIDIRPRRDPNVINIRGKGKIPVAILSTAEFDASSEVDEGSLRFGMEGDEASLAFCARQAKDVNGDGFMDLVCRFNTQATGLQQGDTEAFLEGETLGGRPIVGSDSVIIRGF